MPNESTQLQTQLAKLATAKTDRQRSAIEKSVLLWGSRLYQWTRNTAALLERQLKWLDANEGKPTADKRFTEWESLLRQYEGACDLLREAEQALGASITTGIAA